MSFLSFRFVHEGLELGFSPFVGNGEGFRGLVCHPQKPSGLVYTGQPKTLLSA